MKGIFCHTWAAKAHLGLLCETQFAFPVEARTDVRS
jgi:hypothetical protein